MCALLLNQTNFFFAKKFSTLLSFHSLPILDKNKNQRSQCKQNIFKKKYHYPKKLIIAICKILYKTFDGVIQAANLLLLMFVLIYDLLMNFFTCALQFSFRAYVTSEKQKTNDRQLTKHNLNSAKLYKHIQLIFYHA